MERMYRKQVALLLSVLPEVAKERCFALHGGTAINLFVRNMPRLSVDIDLTYLPIEDRDTSLKKIGEALERIKASIEKVLPRAHVAHRITAAKLQISFNGADIKLEVNLVNRGTLAEPRDMTLCDKAQQDFDVFCMMPIVSHGQLFGGKIVAALDRQHPRDLFDVRYLLANEGVTPELKTGFLRYAICSDRPINELLAPANQDQRRAMDNQFAGMTDEEFSYEEYERTRKILIETIRSILTDADKQFLMSVKDATPDWSIYNFEAFPAVRWKLQHLRELKEKNPEKHRQLYERLERVLREG